VSAERFLDDRQRAELLADAAGAVAWASDASTALSRVAQLAVPRLADWCAVDVLDEGSTYRRVAVAHADPGHQPRAERLLGRWEPHPERGGVAHVVRTGERQWASHDTDPTALVPAQHPERERLVGELGVAGYVSVPIRAEGRALGALTLVAASPSRRFTEADVSLAETLARMAALTLTQARLGQELAVVNRRQDGVLAVLSHELRTPLTAMMAWLQLLHHRTDAAETARALDVIERNGRLLGRLIDDLMDTSHIVMGKVRVDRRAVDLAAIVQRVAGDLAASARDKGVQLELQLDRAARCQGDRERLAQIVMALLTNALKFTPSGGRVLVTLECDPATVWLRVSDTGQGIAPELLPHVFDVFRRDEHAPGLGLGLVVVRGLVALHGGSAEAFSEGLGRGATFSVRLPRH
jgi:signal transduction histidine kinase